MIQTQIANNLGPSTCLLGVVFFSFEIGEEDKKNIKIQKKNDSGCLLNIQTSAYFSRVTCVASLDIPKSLTISVQSSDKRDQRNLLRLSVSNPKVMSQLSPLKRNTTVQISDRRANSLLQSCAKLNCAYSL